MASPRKLSRVAPAPTGSFSSEGSVPTETEGVEEVLSPGAEEKVVGGEDEVEVADTATSPALSRTEIIQQKVLELKQARGKDMLVELLPTKDPEVYKFGNKVLHLSVHKGALVVRVGGGFITIDEFLEKNEYIEARKALRGMSQEDLVAEALRLRQKTMGQDKQIDTLQQELKNLKEAHDKTNSELEGTQSTIKKLTEKDGVTVDTLLQEKQNWEIERIRLEQKGDSLTSRISSLEEQSNQDKLRNEKQQAEDKSRCHEEKEALRRQITENIQQHEKTMSEAKHLYEQQITSLKQDASEEKSRYEAKIEEQIKVHHEATKKKEEEHQRAIDDLKSKHALEIERLTAQHKQEIEKLEARVLSDGQQNQETISGLKANQDKLLKQLDTLKTRPTPAPTPREIKSPTKESDKHQVTTQKVKEFLEKNQGALPCPLVESERPGFYTFGLRTINVVVLDGSLMVRVGGGFVTMDTFIEKYGRAEARKMHKQAILTQQDEQAIVKNLAVHRMNKFKQDGGVLVQIPKNESILSPTSEEFSMKTTSFATTASPLKRPPSLPTISPSTRERSSSTASAPERKSTLTLTAKTPSPGTSRLTGPPVQRPTSTTTSVRPRAASTGVYATGSRSNLATKP